jgi:ubiquitin-protein ligase E3 A
LPFAFTDKQCKPYEFAEAEDITRATTKLSRMGAHGLGAHLSDVLPRAVARLRDSGPMQYIFGAPVSTASWVGRLAALTLLLLPATELDQQRTLARFVAEEVAKSDETCRWLSRLPAASLHAIVEELQNLFAMLLSIERSQSPDLAAAASCIAAVHKANTMHNSRGTLSYQEFYNGTALDFSDDDIVRDYERQLLNERRPTEQKEFCFSRFPCLVDTRFKSMLLQFEAIVQTRQQLQSAAIRSLFSQGEDPYLTLNIRRDRLVQSALWEVQRKTDSLKKPLRIQFIGEEGIDAGGVRKEFFQLLTKALLDPNFGMFYETDDHALWFQPRVKCAVSGDEFQLIGTLLGLAVYNNVILDVSFPRALYRKLLGAPLDFEDLAEIDPSLASGLTELKQFEETEDATVEDLFEREFVYEYEAFGERKQDPLCPGGEARKLSGRNRVEFVELMTSYLLDSSIRDQFDRFQAGFRAVANRDLLNTLHPEELELLVCGQRSFDFAELEKSARYEGYAEDEPIVKTFWKVLHALSEEDKRLFLKFTTGSDRVPVGGLMELHFVLGKNGDDQDMLPTAHTCFNHLLLPEYKDEETCAAKLRQAIQNCHGFGLQ